MASDLDRRSWGRWRRMGASHVLLIALTPGLQAIDLGFERERQEVAEGGSVEIRVVIGYGPGETPDLFSYGVRVVAGGDGAVSVTSVSVPAALDFTGFAPGATVDLSPDVVGVKGNTGLSNGIQGYTEVLLATFTLVGLEPGVVDLGLDFFRSLGASEDIFVAADGTKLDTSITFGTAQLTVVEAPELEIRRVGSGRVRVGYAMVPGWRYFLRRSVDLADWEVVAETHGGAASGVSLEFLMEPADRAYFRLEALVDGS